jgi:hypothetical protein
MAHYESPAESAAIEGLFSFHGQGNEWATIKNDGDDIDVRGRGVGREVR